MKKILIVISLCTLLQSLFAQKKATINLKAGFGICKPKTNNSPRWGLSYNFGLETSIPLKANLIYLNPSVDYIVTNYIPGATPGSNTLSVRVNYATLSLPIIFFIDDDFFIGIGPYIANALSGKFELITGGNTTMKFGDAITDNRKKMDKGIIVKAGMAIGYGSLLISANLGLGNVVPNAYANTASIKTRGFLGQISFPLYKKRR